MRTSVWAANERVSLRAGSSLGPAPPPPLSRAGSSTGQAPGHDSEVLLKPVRIFPDPFRGAPNILVLCECIAPDGTPIPSNTRRAADEAFNKALHEKPW